MLIQKTKQKQRGLAFYRFCGNIYNAICFVVITMILSWIVNINMTDISNYPGNELFYIANLSLGYIMLITASMAVFLAGAYLGVKIREK